MLVYSICQTALPIIMLMVIRCVETDDTGELQWLSEWTTVDSMVYWILAYAVFQAGAAVANHWQLHAAFHVGQRVRAQLIMLVFQKALRVDPQRRPSVGHTLTLMASDAQKFLEAMPFIHKLWGSPLQIVLAGAVLVSTISASALCGILVLIALVPISKNLGKLLQRLVKGGLFGAGKGLHDIFALGQVSAAASSVHGSASPDVCRAFGRDTLH